MGFSDPKTAGLYVCVRNGIQLNCTGCHYWCPPHSLASRADLFTCIGGPSVVKLDMVLREQEPLGMNPTMIRRLMLFALRNVRTPMKSSHQLQTGNIDTGGGGEIGTRTVATTCS